MLRSCFPRILTPTRLLSSFSVPPPRCSNCEASNGRRAHGDKAVAAIISETHSNYLGRQTPGRVSKGRGSNAPPLEILDPEATVNHGSPENERNGLAFGTVNNGRTRRFASLPAAEVVFASHAARRWLRPLNNARRFGTR